MPKKVLKRAVRLAIGTSMILLYLVGAVWVGSIGAFAWIVVNAPEGYEDQEGFHLGRQSRDLDLALNYCKAIDAVNASPLPGGSSSAVRSSRTRGKLQRRGRQRILIVDDDPSVAKLVGTYMDRFGYECRSLDSPENVLSCLENNPCDLVVLDLHMPEIGGAMVLEMIRERFPRLPVILFSGSCPDEQEQSQLIRAGANGFVRKTSPVPEIFSVFLQALSTKEFSWQQA